MFWRYQLKDISLLYSLLDDLQLFWQFKALEWEKLARTVALAAEEDRRTGGRRNLSIDKRLAEILENNEDYRTLRDRLIEQLQEATAIADFLGMRKISSLRTLGFNPPLPENPPLETAISEVESLARYAEKANYPWHTCLTVSQNFWRFMMLAFRKKFT